MDWQDRRTSKLFLNRDLSRSTNGFANASRSLGAGPGDAVFVLLGRIPELYIAILGALKAKCVLSPLFSVFGPELTATRMEIGAARVLVTTQALYRRKIEALRPRLPKLEHVILVDAEGAARQFYGGPSRSFIGFGIVQRAKRFS